jgi:hypothetical protein
VPGLYKIFDEILVNAADNKVRDPKMDTLKVDIDVVSPKVYWSRCTCGSIALDCWVVYVKSVFNGCFP